MKKTLKITQTQYDKSNRGSYMSAPVFSRFFKQAGV